MRIFYLQNPTVQCGADFSSENPTMRFGAVLPKGKSCGAVETVENRTAPYLHRINALDFKDPKA